MDFFKIHVWVKTLFLRYWTLYIQNKQKSIDIVILLYLCNKYPNTFYI